MNIEYRSISDMNNAILRSLYKLPKDIDLVIGIPRSGMLPANLIALYINKPFTDIDSFVEGRIYSSGERGKNLKELHIKNVLVVDDSIHSGSALHKAKDKLKNIVALNIYNLFYGAIYAIERSKELVDFYCEVTSPQRIFQWNFFHHKDYISQSYFDIDGVLCPNPPHDDDGPIYLNYISNAPVLYKPTVPIDTLVSCRLEKYRKVTEQWLARNGFIYKNLIMLDLPNKSSRIKWGKHGQFKGKLYKKSTAPFFVESSLHEANEIVNVAKRPVFCVETFSMLTYHPSRLHIILSTIYWKFRGLLHI